VDLAKAASPQIFSESFHHVYNLAMITKNAVSWDVAPRGFNINRRFGGKCHLHLQDRINDFLPNIRRNNLFYTEDGGDTFLRNVGLY
jgi:hypothetical protein